MRPPGLAPVTVAMCVLNPAGFLFLDEASRTPAMLTAFGLVVVTYLVLWYFWQGRNWARWLVLLTSGAALLNLLVLATAPVIEQVLIVTEAALGAFLLYWLNTRTVRGFFSSKARD